MKPRFLTISCSLDPNSYSYVLARHVDREFERFQGADFIDLRDYELPLSNGSDQSAYDHPMVKELHDRIMAAQGIVIAAPIYNYTVNAACKNLIELTGTPHGDHQSGNAWHHKVIGFVAVAGGEPSYMAPLGLLNSLMLDFRAVIVPRYVLAMRTHFENHLPTPEIVFRLNELVDNVTLFTRGLRDYILQ